MLWLFTVLASAWAAPTSGAAPKPTPAPAPAPKPAPPAPDPDEPITPDDDDDGLDTFKDTTGNEDLLGDEGKAPTSGDSEAVYRSAMTKLGKLEPDEELAGWEAYLAQFPTSVFRTRIENRMDQLTDQMYSGGIQPEQGPKVDASKKELGFAEGLQIENIDPRNRISVGFEMGLPNYVNLALDYEGQLARSLSLHAGIQRRFTGVSIEGGVHWALVKSLRTQTLVTLIGDLRYNANPAFPAFRPQLAVGKRFGRVDLQAQAGADLGYRAWTGPAPALDKVTAIQPAIVGGASLFYAATPKVGVFAESSIFMKDVPADGAFKGGWFRFNVFTFGMRFFPSKNDQQQVNLGATIPYMSQWWGFHYGSIMGNFDYYMK